MWHELRTAIAWLTGRWENKEEIAFSKWFDEQKAILASGGEITPPWIAFPDSDELEGAWGGWRQGYGEGWLDGVWLPFWHRLSDAEQHAYVDKWKASPGWREYLLVHWIN
jgi:hypothetical protein